MESRKISTLLNGPTVSKFGKRKQVEVKDLLGGQFSVNKNIRFKTPMVRLDLPDYSDAYIIVKGKITVGGTSNANETNKKLVFKNNAPFRSCI